VTTASAIGVVEGGVWAPWSFPYLFRPLTSIQRKGLLAFVILSAVDVCISAFLFFGGGGGYVEENPVIAWATGSLFLFLAVMLVAKAIGTGLLALLASLGNSGCTIAGDASILATVGTTVALFLYEFVTLGARPVLLAALGPWFPPV
jgi:hypothetical protein